MTEETESRKSVAWETEDEEEEVPQMTEETESRKSVAWETEDEEEEVKLEGEGGTLKVARVVPVFTVPCGHCKVGVLLASSMY